jgi:hypothetical protein
VIKKGKGGSGRGRKVLAKSTPATWQVSWHPIALAEKNAISDADERVAIAHVIEKLEVDGPALRSPHQSGVMGEDGAGLRELRPRRGRSRWRPLYRRVDERLFAILAVAPESEVDSGGYEKGVKAAKRRLAALEKGTKS